VNLLTDYNLLTEYVERAVQLEDLAADAPDPTLVARLLRKARIYRKLATKLANDYGLPPSPPNSSTPWCATFDHSSFDA